MKQLTLAQAIERGYTYYGFKDSGYQNLLPIDDISDISPDDFPEDALLFGVNPYYTPKITPEEASDLVADFVAERTAEATGDDTMIVHDTIKKLDFSAFADVVNLSLADRKYYTLTDIKLIP